FLTILALHAFAANSVHEIAKRVDQRYNDLQSFRADFTESYRGNGIDRSESGTLYLKRPGKMRWEYADPRPKLFLSDGKTAWFYVPGEQQARKAPVNKLDDLRSPLRYLLGKTKLEKEFDGLALAPDLPPLEPGDIVLRGRPKGMEDRIDHVVLDVSAEGQIRQIVIVEVDGSTTEFRFRNITENSAISDRQFRFTPPPGVETIQISDLAGQQ